MRFFRDVSKAIRLLDFGRCSHISVIVVALSSSDPQNEAITYVFLLHRKKDRRSNAANDRRAFQWARAQYELRRPDMLPYYRFSCIFSCVLTVVRWARGKHDCTVQQLTSHFSRLHICTVLDQSNRIVSSNYDCKSILHSR